MFAVDDYRDFLGCLAVHPDVKTPNIDRLASKGVTFNNAHCQAPMCSSSRASLLSGILPSTSGCYGFQPMRSIPMLRDAATIPQHFRQNGYHVLGTGKIHHGKPIHGHGPHESEWDEYWPSITEPVINFNGKPSQSVTALRSQFRQFQFGISDTSESECGDARHAAWASAQLKRQFSQPFFLGVGFYRPHLPFICPRKYFELYDRQNLSSILVKDNALDDIPDAGRYLSKYLLDDTIRDRNLQLDIIHAYLACVSYMDAQVGAVLDALENSQYKDNTIVVFWSDNGWHFGEKLTWSKFTLWKEATRVPLIISAPGLTKGAISTKPVGLIDVYPTLLELCNLPKPSQKLQGRSICPLLKKPHDEWSYGAVTTHGRDSHCITTERWKYIKYFDGTEELYDRGNDNYEWINLAEREFHNKIKQELKQWLPTINVPNALGSTLKAYFSTDYPDLQKWRNDKAKWKEERGEIKEAIELYQRSVSLETQQPLWVYQSLGTLLIKNKQPEIAIPILEKAISIYPDDAKLYRILGRAYNKNNVEDKVIENFQKALALNPNQPAWIENKIRKYQIKK